MSQKSRLAEAIRYALTRWAGLTLFLDDGRAEIDANVVERAIRPLALTRKNALLAGSDGGAEPWAVIALLVETCKLTGVEPQAYLADVISRCRWPPAKRQEEFVFGAAEPAQLRPLEAHRSLQMREQRFNLLALIARALETRRAGQASGHVAGFLMDGAGQSAPASSDSSAVLRADTAVVGAGAIAAQAP